MLRTAQLLPLEGLLALGFDPASFQTKFCWAHEISRLAVLASDDPWSSVGQPSAVPDLRIPGMGARANRAVP
jgi:hypothetical protein